MGRRSWPRLSRQPPPRLTTLSQSTPFLRSPRPRRHSSRPTNPSSPATTPHLSLRSSFRPPSLSTATSLLSLKFPSRSSSSSHSNSNSSTLNSKSLPPCLCLRLSSSLLSKLPRLTSPSSPSRNLSRPSLPSSLRTTLSSSEPQIETKFSSQEWPVAAPTARLSPKPLSNENP